MKRYRIAGLSIAALFALYLLLGFFAVPALVKSQLTQFVETKLKHKLSIGEMRFNPLTLAAEVNDLALSESSGAHLVSFKRLFVNFQLSSLFRRAWTFAEVTLEAPKVTAELRADGRFNFSALLDALRAPEPKPDEPLPRLEIDLIKLSDGVVDLADLQAGNDARLTLAPISFELAELSTLPSEKAPYKLAARTVAGERIEWHGDITLNPIASAGAFTLTGWKLATLKKLAGDRIAIDQADGEIGIRVNYQAAYDKGTPALALANSEIKLDKISLRAKGTEAPLIAVDSARLAGVQFDLAKKAVAAETLDAANGEVNLGINADGEPNWAALIPKAMTKDGRADPSKDGQPSATESSESKPAPVNPWRAKIGAIKLTDISARYTDQRATQSLTIATEQVGVTGSVETGPVENAACAQLGNLRLSAGSLRFTRPNQRIASGALQFDTPAVTAALSSASTVIEFEQTRLDIAQLNARLADDDVRVERVGAASKALKLVLNQGAPPQAELDTVSVDTGGISARLANAKTDTLTVKSLVLGAGKTSIALAEPNPDVKVDAITATLDALALRDPQSSTELARLRRGELSGGNLRLAERATAIDRVMLADGFAVAHVEASGKLNWDPLIVALTGPKPTPAAKAPLPAGGDAFRATVKTVELRNFGAALADQRQKPPIALTLQEVNARAQNFTTDAKQSAQVDLTGRLKEGGQFSANGRVNLSSLETDLKVKVADLSLTPAQAFITPHARLQLISALTSANGRLRYGQPKAAGANLVFEGDVDLAKVQIDETEPTLPFLELDTLKASQLKLTLTPNRLDIPELRVSGLASKLLIAEDQSVNITKVLRNKEPAVKPGAEPIKPATAGKPTEAGAEDAFSISISRIRLDNSRLEFSDLSLRPQFATRMHELKGVITGISTSRGTRAQLELDARVDEFGSARIRGDINLFKPRAYTDVDMVFRNLEMTALTPYSAKFAGYRIASGKLSMDLQYKIKDSALLGENRIVLDKLELGERVESPTAFNLPLEFAIAILKDSDGKIDLGLPVSGSLDDPQFSYGAIIWKAIGNLITRIVTAPFRALASLFGGGSEKLEAIDFDPGNERLQPPERQKLRTISEALAKRPQLKLTVKPAYSPAADRPTLQTIAVRRDIHTRAGVKLEPGEAPGPIDFNHARSQQAIQAAFQERFGAPALRDLRASLAKPDPAAAAQGAKPQAPPPDQIYRILTERLIDAHPVTEAQLRELATRRGEAIVKELIDAGKTDAARISALAPEEVSSESMKVVPVALELGVAK